jgi:predicted 3-demethylubiquinone-9 3-methyltransferase (glyoxalase superfamily)
VSEYRDKFVAAGGTPVASGWITDHFGVSCQINPTTPIDLIIGGVSCTNHDSKKEGLIGKA